MQVECRTFQLLWYNTDMYYVYVLKSEKDGRFYFGYSSNLKQRFIAHNKGRVRYTRNFKPWKLVYYEAYVSERYARYRERQIKYGGKVYAQLKRRIEKSINES